MNRILILAMAGVLAGCTTTMRHHEIREGQDDHNAQFLLEASAKDFRKSLAGSVRVRDVRLGHIKTPAGGRQYLLCGEFLHAVGDNAGDWTPFTTIRTFGYEQWLGSEASTLCQRPGIGWDPRVGLASALQLKLEAAE